MKDFLKHVLTVILFICGLFILLIPVSKLVNPKTNEPGSGTHDIPANGILGEPEDTIDVVIVGDSESYSTFIPLEMYEQYGITAYCCGSSGQYLTYSMSFLDKTFERHSPKVVILETDCIFHYFSLTDVMHIYADKYFPVFEYHNRWKTLTPADLDFTVNYTHQDNTKGYWFSVEVKEADADGYMKEIKDSPDVTSRNKQFVNYMKSWCEERGAKLILISAPSTINWNIERHNHITRLSEELGLDYIDMNTLTEEIGIDWAEDTYDKGDHLNYYGASKVTAYVGKYLHDTGLLTDRRGDPKYADWDQVLAEFRQRVEDSK